MNVVAQLIRDPAALVAEAEEQEAFRRIAPTLLGTLVVCAGIFGAVVGSYRGGVQVPLAALKLVVVWLVPAMVVLPAVRALWGLCGVDVTPRKLALGVMVGAARSALLGAAAAPLLWLALSVSDYHLAVLEFSGAFGIAVLMGCGTMLQCIGPGGSRRYLAAGVALLLFGLTTMQTGWMMRPFVVRPTSEVTALRSLEEDVFSSLVSTTKSSLGIYDGWSDRESP